MRPLVARLYLAMHAKWSRHGGRRDRTARPWTQGNELHVGGHRTRFLDAVMCWAIGVRRPFT
jgi:hypothetical protein